MSLPCVHRCLATDSAITLYVLFNRILVCDRTIYASFCCGQPCSQMEAAKLESNEKKCLALRCGLAQVCAYLCIIEFSSK